MHEFCEFLNSAENVDPDEIVENTLKSVIDNIEAVNEATKEKNDHCKLITS
jgi:hypothetical protein